MLALSSFRAVTTCLLLYSLLLVAACGLHADVLFQEDFESGLGEWTVDNGVWEVGTPTSGPMAAYAGEQCAATVLAGNFPAGVNSRLISPPIALPPSAPGQEIWVQFWAWYVYNGYDDVFLQVQTRNWDSTWSDWSYVPDGQLGGANDGYPHASPWSLIAKELTQYAGQTIKLGFYHIGSAPQGPNLGCYLDDVSVTVGVPTASFPQTFEGGWEGWHTDGGVWQVGTPTVGPPSAHAGTHCAGTILDANLPNWAALSKLVSPTVRLPAVEAGQTITLRVWEWWSLTAPYTYNGGNISVLDSGSGSWSAWSQLPWSIGHTTATSGGWVQNSADLTPYAGEAVRLGFGIAWFTEGAGYYIDDIELDVPLSADFVGVPQAGAAPLPVQFTDTSMGGATTWAWDFGDSGTSALQNPSHVYAAPGSYAVSLTVGKDAETDTETKADYIVVVPATAADFSASQTSGLAPLSVTFTDLTVPAATSWAWSFGDGANSSFQNPTHVYAAAGVYTVSLIAGDAYSTDTETKTAYITVAEPLVADFDGTPLQGTFPFAVSFTDTSTGGPTSWFWSFGDGANSDQRNPSHEYGQPGTKTVTLSVSNDFASDSKTRSGFVKVSFVDVPFDSMAWAVDEVLACVDVNVVKGYDDGKYHPEYEVTRDQMAVYVSRALVIPSGDAAIPDPVPPPTFSDVSSTHWAYKQIEYAVAKNVVKGYDDGTYKPDLVVDRGQMAVFVARAMVTPSGDAGIPVPVPPPTFSDVPSDFWAYKQVEYCVGQGVVKGYEDGLYHPDFVVTRDQMAVYVARAFGLL